MHAFVRHTCANGTTVDYDTGLDPLEWCVTAADGREIRIPGRDISEMIARVRWDQDREGAALLRKAAARIGLAVDPPYKPGRFVAGLPAFATKVSG